MAQGIAEVSGAGGILYWPMMARRSLKFGMSVVEGKSLKLAKSLAAANTNEPNGVAGAGGASGGQEAR